MGNLNPKYENLKVLCPVDCGNAPKKLLLKQLNIAFAKNDIVFITENITDDFHWNIIGEKLIQGKEDFANTLKQMPNSKVLELQINNIITHGKTASVDGTIILENKRNYAFCNVYNFTSAGKNSKVKEKTSYVIEIS